ncbi:hypothetical protein QMN66_24775, partial [Escherichia coli]|nr:hypothetical protein [Escherichia coli]
YFFFFYKKKPASDFPLRLVGGEVCKRDGDTPSRRALLFFLFLVARVARAPLAIVRRRWLPARGTRLQTAATGLMLIGGYSVCY